MDATPFGPYQLQELFGRGSMGRWTIGTVTLVSVGAWKDRWGEHRNGVVQGPPLVRHERGMEVWM